MQVEDRRFAATDWMINFEVPTEQADNWLRYLTAECGKREWSSGGISQMEAKENSGSITFNDRTVSRTWRWFGMQARWSDQGPRRPVGTPLDEANELFKQVNARMPQVKPFSFSRRGTCTTKDCLGAASCGWTKPSG